MLGTIYFSSVLISTVLLTLSSCAMVAKLKKEGYKIDEQKTLAERLVDISSVLIQMAIPLYNIIVGVASIFLFEQTYEKLKKDKIKKGTLKRMDEKYEVELDLGTNDLNKRKYSELSNEEKLECLEEEREILLSKRNTPEQENTSAYNHGVYQKNFKNIKK